MQQAAQQYALTMQHFRKTQEGMQAIMSGRPFILGGEIWQGFQGTPIQGSEVQLADSEIAEMQDFDGTKDRILKIRADRLRAREVSREKEMAEREAKRRAARRDELELRKLEKELGEPSEGKALIPTAAIHKCDRCDKEFPTPQRLRGHYNFAHGNHPRGRKKKQATEAPAPGV